MTATPVLSIVNPSDHVTSRILAVTVNGVPLADMEEIDGPTPFTVNDGDVLVGTLTDTNAAGSTTSATVTVTAALPLQPPAQPTLGFTFS
jgi:hypothetical protein